MTINVSFIAALLAVLLSAVRGIGTRNSRSRRAFPE